MTTPKSQLSPIGGYFEFELPSRRELPHPKLNLYQSARAAFLALLRAGKPSRVWMPKYICNAMLAPLRKVGIEYIWYDLTDDLEVGPDVEIGADDWLLYVNYFGICDAKVQRLLNRFNPEQVVLDFSQAFFSPPIEKALATIYSPRKFFGVPDGGLLFCQIPINTPKEIDIGSLSRAEHLIKRLGDCPEAGYTAYLRAEESLTDIEPKEMSCLSKHILYSINFESIRRIRRENFKTLDELLLGGVSVDMDETAVPLCYPYRSKNSALRQNLLNNKIFVATYWTDSLGRLSSNRGDTFVRNMLPLPIDQRYGKLEMERIAAIIQR